VADREVLGFAGSLAVGLWTYRSCRFGWLEPVVENGACDEYGAKAAGTTGAAGMAVGVVISVCGRYDTG
jgi:hypothetical protein